MRRLLTVLLLASAALTARAATGGDVALPPMDWHTFGVVVAVACGLVLLASFVWQISPLRLGFSARDKNTWAALCLCAAIATVEAQKPTNNVPQNLNAPMGGGRVFLTGFTGLTGLERPAGSQGLGNPVNLVNPVKTAVLDEDIARGYALVEENDNAASIVIPTNAVTLGNWHRHGARSSIGNHRLDWQGLAAKPNGAPQC